MEVQGPKASRKSVPQSLIAGRTAGIVVASALAFACSSYDSDSAAATKSSVVGGTDSGKESLPADAVPRPIDAAKAPDVDSGGGAIDPPPELHSCDAARAVGVVTSFEQGFLEVIAYAEGTRNSGPYDGYNVMFTYKTASECVDHPNQRNCSGVCSTAAGRYQFLYTTWLELDLPNFMPDNQARGAMSLITDKRKAVIPKTRALTATEFANVLDKVSWEWASLPPGRYGQPVRTRTQCRTAYCNEVPCS